MLVEYIIARRSESERVLCCVDPRYSPNLNRCRCWVERSILDLLGHWCEFNLFHREAVSLYPTIISNSSADIKDDVFVGRPTTRVQEGLERLFVAYCCGY